MWNMDPRRDEIPVVPSFDPVARDVMQSLDERTMEAVRGHVATINNTNVILFIAFMIPIAAPAFAIYYFIRRSRWDDLRSTPDLRLIEGAYENADPDQLKVMKRSSQRAVQLGRFFDARDTYKWLILGNLGIVIFYGICVCGGFFLGLAGAM